MAGYSGTLLAGKLGIREGATVVLLNAPENLELDLPSPVVLRHQARGGADVVVAFFTQGEGARTTIRLARVDGLPVGWPLGRLAEESFRHGD